MRILLILALLHLAVCSKHGKFSSSEIWNELGADVNAVHADNDVTPVENSIEDEDDEDEISDKTTKDDYERLLAKHNKIQEDRERQLKRERKMRRKALKAEEAHGIACAKKHCPLGKECVIDEDDDPICVCAKVCAPENSERAMVCSTKNVTFASECELHRQKCLCHREEFGCANPKFAHAKLDYYGPCVEMRPCTDHEQHEFPMRMREWLYYVMEELAQRDSLNDKAKQMAVKAEEMNHDESEEISETERWMIPAVWKFCELDETHDDLVDNGELIPITAPLKGMEHCIGYFMEGCDVNLDGNISKKEWIKCLELDIELVDKLELQCEEFHD